MALWPVSQRYLDTLGRSHVQVTYFEILRDGVVVASMKGGQLVDPNTGATVYSVGGSISVSNTTVRRSGTITFADPTNAFGIMHAEGILAPYVSEIRCWVGVKYWNETEAIFGGQSWFSPGVTGGGSNLFSYGAGIYGSGVYSGGSSGTLYTYGSGSFGAGLFGSGGGTSVSVDSSANLIFNPNSAETTVELIPVGTLVVTNPQTQDHQISVQGYDRMWLLDNFAAPFTVSRGTPVATALTSLLALKVPATRLETDLLDSEDTVDGTLTFDADTSVADALARIASAAGQKIAVDQMGRFVSYLPPSTSSNPELILAPGQGSVMYRPQRTIGGTDGPFNVVVYTNEGGSNPPARGVAIDSNPNSLTCVDRIGIRPKFLSDPQLADNNACGKAARAALLTTLGTSDVLTVNLIPNHALDTDVVLQVTDSDQGIESMNVITDTFTVPFRTSDGVMSVQCKANVSLT